MAVASARSQLRDDLRRLFRGTLHTEDITCQLYATDASLFRVEPLAVAVPHDEEDLQLLVKHASERNLSLIPRGAGTGLAGEALGHGLVVDLSVHFRKILASNEDSVRVQPGIVLQQLNNELRKQGRRFAPNPASAASCTLGGMLATNASGGNAALHGYTREHVRSLRVVWEDGTADDTVMQTAPQTRELVAATTTLLQTNAELIDTHLDRL